MTEHAMQQPYTNKPNEGNMMRHVCTSSLIPYMLMTSHEIIDIDIARHTKFQVRYYQHSCVHYEQCTNSNQKLYFDTMIVNKRVPHIAAMTLGGANLEI